MGDHPVVVNLSYLISLKKYNYFRKKCQRRLQDLYFSGRKTDTHVRLSWMLAFQNHLVEALEKFMSRAIEHLAVVIDLR